MACGLLPVFPVPSIMRILICTTICRMVTKTHFLPQTLRPPPTLENPTSHPDSAICHLWTTDKTFLLLLPLGQLSTSVPAVHLFCTVSIHWRWHAQMGSHGAHYTCLLPTPSLLMESRNRLPDSSFQLVTSHLVSYNQPHVSQQ